MRIFKLLKKIVVVCLVIAACNVALTYALEPYGSRSQLSWVDYAAQDEIDTLLVGTSHVEYAVDPSVLNEELGWHAYNLATPSQSIEESYVGIRTAYEKHHIKRVILGLSTDALTSDSPPNPGSAFMRNRALQISFPDSLTTLHEFLWHYDASSTAYSLDFLFPWASNPLRSLNPADIAQNIQAKLTKSNLAQAASRAEAGWEYVGLGHGARRDSINLNSSSVRAVNEVEDQDAELGAVVEENVSLLNVQRANTAREICEYCAIHDIELTVIVPPLPTYNVFDERSNYISVMEQASSLFAEAGIKVFDFNLAKSGLFQTRALYFSDNFHLNLKGAQVFSRSLARFCSARSEGLPVDDLFASPEEKRRSMTSIAALFVRADVSFDGVNLNWRAVANPEQTIEYRVVSFDASTNEYKAISEWTLERSFAYHPATHGLHELHIYARLLGEKNDKRVRSVRFLW